MRTSAGRRRRPDAGVDCGERRDDAHEASEPRVVVEVLSPSTKAIDLLVKLDEYRAVPSLQEIVIVDPDAPQARLWFREAGGAWEARLVEELEASIELPSLGLALPLREIYEGIEFRPRPQAIA